MTSPVECRTDYFRPAISDAAQSLTVMEVSIDVVDAQRPILIVLALHLHRVCLRDFIVGPRRKDVFRRNVPTAIAFFLGRTHDFLPRLCGDELGETCGFGLLVQARRSQLVRRYRPSNRQRKRSKPVPAKTACSVSLDNQRAPEPSQNRKALVCSSCRTYGVPTCSRRHRSASLNT